MNVSPAVINEASELGQRCITAMELAGRYAYAGREWVVERVRKFIGGAVTDMVHNHHNYAWGENHGGKDLSVVHKGATPAFPGQRGFVGGSMGDAAVIDSEEARASLYSAIHGAGRLFGRKEAKRRFAREEMDAWLPRRGVTLIGADLDESPMASSAAARGSGAPCRLGEGAAYAAPVRGRDGRCRRVRSVQGLTTPARDPTSKAPRWLSTLFHKGRIICDITGSGTARGAGG